MRKIKKWRYYCDFCKKSGASEHHMKNHEKYCTSNPNRECRICDKLQEVQQPLVELLRVYKDGGLKELRAVAGNCPMCILWALKAALKPEEIFESYEHDFDFKKELDDFWKEYNQLQREEQYY